MDMADMAWEAKCREEDMKQRALENERHAIEDARRSVDEKAQQLQVLANQSALFAGFSMVSDSTRALLCFALLCLLARARL